MFTAAILLGACVSQVPAPPKAQDGVIDLSNWDFNKNGPVALQGEWRFVWHELVDNMPADLFRQRYTKTITVPSTWPLQTHPEIPGKMLAGTGFATYGLLIHLPKNLPDEALALWSKATNSTAQLSLSSLGGDSLGRVTQGAPGKTRETTTPVWSQIYTEFSATAMTRQRSVMLYLQISNFDHARGGVYYSPQFGPRQGVFAKLSQNKLTEFGVFAICFIIGLYHFILFSQRRSDQSLFYFALFCATMAMRQWLTGQFSQSLGLGHSRLAFRALMSLEYCTLPLLLTTGWLFVGALVPTKKFTRFVQIWVLACGTLLILLALFTRPLELSGYLKMFQIHLYVGLGAALVFLLTESFRGNTMAGWVLLPSGVLAIATMNDTLLSHGVISSVLLSPYAFVLFILLQSAILSGRSAAAHQRAEHLGEHLKQEVAAQTNDLNVKTLEAKEAALEATLAKEEADSLRMAAVQHARELQELDQQKTAFFQNMSHELRTPLTLILNPLEEERQEQPKNKNLEVATNNSRRLLRLVNQLLEFQKVGAGKKILHLQTVELSQFAQVCGDYFAQACAGNHIEFSVLCEQRPYIQAEIDALEKITFNFLSNALKYTPEFGKIELRLSCTEARARLAVRDTGPGISAAGQDKLFLVFSQVDESTTRNYEGSGLGLALAKSLAEEMHGKVGVESTLGQGATFWVEFPICDPPQEEVELGFTVKDWLLADNSGKTDGDYLGIVPTPQTNAQDGSELVLVVDDLQDMRDLIGRCLEKKNYRVAQAPNGKRGVEIANKICPDLIITDWMMPQMSGPDLIEAIKEGDSHVSSIPIVLLTAKSDEESKLIGTNIGADAFLGKPFSEQELTSTVRNLLSLKSREREVQALNQELTENVLKRYLPPTLVEDILRGNFQFSVEPQPRLITVLFSDLCGFTKLGESLHPAEYAAQLNEYLSFMNEIIFNHHGTVDKFIGDAIMVLFGAPQEMSAYAQAQRAIICATAMHGGLEMLNEKWRTKGWPQLRARIGIHQGEALVGNFGSKRRSDYTGIGSTVNLAARIETVCEPGQVFVSSIIAEHLPDEVHKVGMFELRGIEEPQTLFQVG